MLESYVSSQTGGQADPLPGPNKQASARENIAQRLTRAAESPRAPAGTGHLSDPDFRDTVLAYNDPGRSARPAQGGEFGFGDLVDMVNPLHHIPLLGTAYREISGDEIKPISKIIGGAVFGGAAGAATGTIDVVVQDATGKDIQGNLLTALQAGELDPENALPGGANTATPDHPQARLDAAARAYGHTGRQGAGLHAGGQDMVREDITRPVLTPMSASTR